MTSERKHRLFIVDDHPIVLSGLNSLLSEQADLEVVGQAEAAADAMEQIESTQPDLVIVDGSLPGMSGAALVSHLTKRFPGIRTLALTLHEEGAYVRAFFRAGAKGFVLKASAADDLLKAIRAVLAGGVYVDPAIAGKVIPLKPVARARGDGLSDREESVLRLVASGHCNKEISTYLGLSTRTVETYRARAFEKLGLRSRVAVLRHAMAEGWFLE
ncbi:response regulator transcription factor [Aureimonas sp. AU4]|uniref:response regulator n=1 Tax=Aureimonas sp. AU4 TaxID=1638163 RepID=UPI0009E9BCDB|nr:response regulator transcription factor [Aureimonas sp. AU4]